MGKNAQSQGLCLTVFAFCLLFLGFRSTRYHRILSGSIGERERQPRFIENTTRSWGQRSEEEDEDGEADRRRQHRSFPTEQKRERETVIRNEQNNSKGFFSCFPFYFLGRLNRFRYLRVWMSTIVSLSIMSPSCDFILIPPLGVDRPFFVFILFLFYLSCQEIPTNWSSSSISATARRQIAPPCKIDRGCEGLVDGVLGR